MTTLLYDGSFNGLLTAIFETFEYKHTAVKIEKQHAHRPGIFDSVQLVISDEMKAKRVWRGLQTRLSYTGRREFYYTFLSELPGIEGALLAYVQYAYRSVTNIEKNFANPVVNMISQTAHSVHREKHRMEAFVRFMRLEDDLYCAFVSPDFNVLPLIAPHFQDRYADQHWLIYDKDRKFGIHHDAESRVVSEVAVDGLGEGPAPMVHEDEVAYQSLWRSYFDHVNIQERKNIKLHVRHMPKRYWADLTEKR